MTFEQPWALWLLLPLAAWAVYQWRSAPRPVLLLLKALSLSAIILALAEPVLRYNDPKVAVAVLADTSASITPEDLTRATSTIRAMESRRGSNYVAVLPFASKTRSLTPDERKGTLAYSAGDSARGTNLEIAIRDAIAALPDGARFIIAARCTQNSS